MDKNIKNIKNIPSIPYTVQVPLGVFPDYQIIDYLSDRLQDTPTEITNLFRGQDVLTLLDSWLKNCPSSPESQLTVILGVIRILIPVLNNRNKIRVNKDFIDSYKVNLQHTLPRFFQALESFQKTII